jgi:hypothetical protein
MAIFGEVISASDIVRIVRGEVPSRKPGSRRGIKKHNEITNEIIRQPNLVFEGFSSETFSKNCITEVRKGRRRGRRIGKIQITAIPDVTINNREAIVEIKPRYNDMHLLQLALTCIVTGYNPGSIAGGFLYYYSQQHPRTNYLCSDLFDCENELVEVARSAIDIKKGEKILKTEGRRRSEENELSQGILWPDSAGIMSRGVNCDVQNEMILTRRHLDHQVGELLGVLTTMLS